jgi:hypothetical protein
MTNIASLKEEYNERVNEQEKIDNLIKNNKIQNLLQLRFFLIFSNKYIL